jgi:hypothetical protein
MGLVYSGEIGDEGGIRAIRETLEALAQSEPTLAAWVGATLRAASEGELDFNSF